MVLLASPPSTAGQLGTPPTTGSASTVPPLSGLSGTGGYGVSANPFLNNPYGSPDFLAGFQPQWNIPTPYDAQVAAAKGMLTSPQQWRNIANQQVGAQISSSLGQINAQLTPQMQYLAAMQNRSAGLAAALGSFGPQYAQTMSGIYNNAAATLGAVGPGVTGQGQADMSNALQAAQAQVAAKTGGQGSIASYNPAAITGTLNTTGVQMPGNALVNQGVDAAQLGYWGAQADKAQAQTVTDYYAQQATQALQQAASERAQVVAQRPELFSQALEAQKQDSLAFQQNYDQLVGNATNYIMNRNQFRLNQLQSLGTWWTEQASLTHVNPLTGQPLGGYAWVPGTQHTVAAPYKDIATGQYQKAMAAAKTTQVYNQGLHWAAQAQHWDNQTSTADKALALKAWQSQKPGKFDKNLSAAFHMVVDSQGRPIPGPNGKVQGYAAPGKVATPLSANDRFKIQGQLGQYVETLAHGTPATAKAAGTQPVGFADAVNELRARNAFSSPFMQASAINALAAAYSTPQNQLTAQDVESAMAYGIDPTQTAPYVGLHPGSPIATPTTTPTRTAIPPAAGRGAGSIVKNIQRAGGVPTARGTR